jgi:Zn-dependent protease with chaperone function
MCNNCIVVLLTLRLAVLSSFLVAGCQAYADAALNSFAPLLDTVTNQTIRSMRDGTLPLGAHLPSTNSVLLICQTGAAYSSTLLLADPKIDGKKIAEILSRSVGDREASSATIEFHNGGEFSQARLLWSRERIGQLNSEMKTPIGNMIAGLRDAEYHVDALLIVPRYVNTNSISFPIFRKPRYTYYLASTASEDFAVISSAQISSSMAWMAPAAFAVPGAVFVLSLLFARRYAMRPNVPLNRKRIVAPRIALWAPLIVILLYMPVLWVMLLKWTFKPWADLWFGSDATFILANLALMNIIFVLLPVGASKWLSGRLSHQNQSKPIHITSDGATDRPIRWFVLRLVIGFTFVSALYLVSQLGIYLGGILPASMDNLRGDIVIGVMMVFAASIWWFSARAEKEALMRLAEISNPALMERVARIADRMNVKFNSVIARELTDPSVVLAGISPGGNIIISQAAVDRLSDTEFEALIAHELAHIKLKHFWRRIAFVFFPFLLVAFIPAIAPMAILRVKSVVVAAILASSTFFAFGWFALASFWIRRRHEFEADRTSLDVTGSLPDVISMLNKAHAGETDFELDETSTHPKMERRIQALREYANRAGG